MNSFMVGLDKYTDPISQHWILAESARRTILMSLAFTCMLTVLKGEVRTSPFFLSPFRRRQD